VWLWGWCWGGAVDGRSIVANETAIVVGHEREAAGQGSVALQHAVFPTVGVNLTNQWVHIAVVRQHESAPSPTVPTQCSSVQDSGSNAPVVCSRTGACACPACGGSPGQNATTYRVYLDGHEILQAGVEPSRIQVVCGPSCHGLSCSQAPSAANASLLFGAYGGPSGLNGGDVEFLDGWLDEWRIWQGVRSQLKIEVCIGLALGLSRA